MTLPSSPGCRRLGWGLAGVLATACGPHTRSTTDGGGSDGGDTTESTGSLSAEDTGAPFECPDARWHEGNLTIDDSTDLDSLRDIGGISGRFLEIVETTSIVDLEFLSCLESVGAEEVSASVSIWRNEALESLHGLERLRTIGSYGEGIGADGHIGISENDALVSIAELVAIEEIGFLGVSRNTSLTEVHLPALRRVKLLDLGGFGGEFGIACKQPDQPATMSLQSVGDYPVLESVDDLSIWNQPGITSLAPLTEAAEAGVVFGRAEIIENDNLPDAEIEAFAAAAGIEPLVCKYEPGDPEVCWQSGPQCGGD